MDIKDAGRFFRSGKGKMFSREMIFSEVVSEFELNGLGFVEKFFSGVKFREIRQVSPAVIVVAFVNG